MQKTQWRSRTSSRKFWWLDNSRPQSSQRKLRISKQSPICSRGAGLGHSMDPSISVQMLHRKLREACTSSWSPLGNLKSFKLTISWNSAKLVKIFPGIIARLHHTDQKQVGLLREQNAEQRKAPLLYCFNQVWKLVGRFYGMLCLSAKRHRFIIWWEDALWRTFRATSWRTDCSIWFIGWVSPYNCQGSVKNPSRIHQFGKKVVLGLFLGYALYAGWIWKGDVLVADFEELETMDASEIYSKRLNAKEVLFPKQGEFIFPKADGRINPLEEIRTWEHPPWYGIDQFKERVILTFLENQKGLFHNIKTNFRLPVKLWMTSGPCEETSYTAITLNNISHFSSGECSEVMSRRTQEDAREQRVTAKSKTMMNLVSRCSVRDPNVLASSASEFPVKPDLNVNYLWARGMSSIKEQGDLLFSRSTRTDSLMTMRWTLNRSRTRNCCSDPDHSWQGEWSIAKDIGPSFKRCNARHRQTFYNLENVYVLNIGSICISWERITQKNYIP